MVSTVDAVVEGAQPSSSVLTLLQYPDLNSHYSFRVQRVCEYELPEDSDTTIFGCVLH